MVVWLLAYSWLFCWALLPRSHIYFWYIPVSPSPAQDLIHGKCLILACWIVMEAWVLALILPLVCGLENRILLFELRFWLCTMETVTRSCLAGALQGGPEEPRLLKVLSKRSCSVHMGDNTAVAVFSRMYLCPNFIRPTPRRQWVLGAPSRRHAGTAEVRSEKGSFNCPQRHPKATLDLLHLRMRQARWCPVLSLCLPLEVAKTKGPALPWIWTILRTSELPHLRGCEIHSFVKWRGL